MYTVLEGKKVKRLDYTLFSLGKLLKDTIYKRMIDLVRRRTRRNGLHGCHRQDMDLEVIQEDKNIFCFFCLFQPKEIQSCDTFCIV